MRSRTGQLLAAAGAVGVLAITGAPTAVAETVATCTSDVADGVEVDYCVGNPNANTVTDVPGVNVEFDLGLGSGSAFDLVGPRPRRDHVPRSIESKALSACSKGAEVTPS